MINGKDYGVDDEEAEKEDDVDYKTDASIQNCIDVI